MMDTTMAPMLVEETVVRTAAEMDTH
jgi:hypothetical protein